MKKILKETGVNINYGIGNGIRSLKRSIKDPNNGLTPPDEEEKRRFEELGVINLPELIEGKESANSELLKVCETLVKFGFSFNNFTYGKTIEQDGKKKKVSTILEDIVQENPELDIKEILKETGVDNNYSIGSKIQNLKNSIKGTGTYSPPNEEEKRRFEELGVINLQELIDGKESANSELLKVCETLVKYGFIFENFKTSKKIKEDGKKKQISTTLEDIAQENPELDIKEVLRETGVDISYKIGGKIIALKNSIKGTNKGTKTANIEEKRRFVELGVINLEKLESSKKVTGQELGAAGFGADTKVCDEISKVFNSELEKNKINQKSE